VSGGKESTKPRGKTKRQKAREMLRINFEFVGGPNDGKVVQGWLGEPSDAERHYLFSHHGRIGQRLKVASPYALEMLIDEGLRMERSHHFQPHYYVVTDRLEDEQEVWVRAEYLPGERRAGKTG
jgi:hypothetical protein